MSKRIIILFAAGLLFSPVFVSSSMGAPADATVAPNGDGQFKSVQDAINAAPAGRLERPWVIHIKPGFYKELIYIQREKRFLRLEGEDPTKCVLSYNLHAGLAGPDGKPIGTFRTASTLIDADDFAAENLTFENSAGPVGQALAIRLDGDRTMFRNCRFLGWQDTILTNRGRHYFEGCYIAGHVDFIFGGATAFFERCHIHCLKDGYITAASTPLEQVFGYVFNHCTITGETPEVKTYLGRPWRAFAGAIFLNTEMSAVVRPVGWNNWNAPDREKTARYGEFNSWGPGANLQARVPWARNLTEVEARSITAEKVLAGSDAWNPNVGASSGLASETRSAIRERIYDDVALKGRVKTDIEYSRVGGDALRLDACVPEGAGPFPAVILVHGGGWSGGDKTQGVDPLFIPLTRAKIAWFSINYRLAPKHHYPAPVEDVEAAIRWVKAHAAEFKVDPNRLALLGESAGGHLVAQTAVRAQDQTRAASRVAAVVAFYAPVDMIADMERRGGLSTSMRGLFGREEAVADSATLEVLRDASPINHIHAGLPPFLLLHGTADMSVLYTWSLQLQTKLRSAGVTCDLITIPDGVHGMGRWENSASNYKDTVTDWITRKLGTAPDSRR